MFKNQKRALQKRERKHLSFTVRRKRWEKDESNFEKEEGNSGIRKELP